MSTLFNQVTTRFQALFSTKSKKLRELVNAYTVLDQFAGSVLVARGSEILLRQASGMADREHQIANTPETRFRIGSMTKPFTAIALMQLVEQGGVKVSDPIGSYVLHLAWGNEVKIEHLLTNTSGIPDYVTMTGFRELMGKPMSVESLLGLFAEHDLDFAPGERFSYSNSNWALLGAVIERVTGKPYHQVIEEYIFAPAKMRHAGYDWSANPQPPFAIGYQHDGEVLVRSAFVHSDSMYAAGGIYATVDDLYQWKQMLKDSTLLRAETLHRMTQAYTQYYGYGWGVGTQHQRPYFGHDGGLDGYLSLFQYFHRDDTVIILLSNLFDAPLNQMAETISAILFGAAYELPSARRFVAVDPRIFSSYVGEYSLVFYGRESHVTIRSENGKLYMNVRGLPEVELRPMSDTTFFSRVKGEAELTFVREADGTVNSIDYNWSGHKLRAKRLR